jgi:hypothetical protein
MAKIIASSIKSTFGREREARLKRVKDLKTRQFQNIKDKENYKLCLQQNH